MLLRSQKIKKDHGCKSSSLTLPDIAPNCIEDEFQYPAGIMASCSKAEFADELMLHALAGDPLSGYRALNSSRVLHRDLTIAVIDERIRKSDLQVRGAGVDKFRMIETAW